MIFCKNQAEKNQKKLKSSLKTLLSNLYTLQTAHHKLFVVADISQKYDKARYLNGLRFAVKILVVEFSDVEAKITIECKRNPETIFEIIMTNDKARHYITVHSCNIFGGFLQLAFKKKHQKSYSCDVVKDVRT